MNRFPKLFTPICIGKLEIKNRLVYPSVCCELANLDGSVSHEQMEFYEERARGEVGLIIIESTYVDRRGKRLPRNLIIDEDSFIPGLRELSQRIKRGGARSCVQITHGGINCVRSTTGFPPVGPSPVISGITHVSAHTGDVPQELTLGQIQQLIKAFIDSAVRVKEADFDAVEIHGAHGYLISNFLSPNVNFRNDSYGGDIRNRVRFVEEIVRGAKERLGSDFPILVRLNCCDYTKGGLEFSDTIVVSKILEKGGADAIDLSVGVHASEPFIIGGHMSKPPGFLVEYAKQLKQHIGIPVITVNRIHDPFLAEEILEHGKADMVAMARPLIADPKLPAKAMQGNIEDIVPCLSCNECFASLYMGRIGCTVNPVAGQELAIKEKMEMRRTPKYVVVIGGGVAGMSCAITAARLNHKVKLFEKQPFLGGLLRTAILAPNRDTLSKLLAYYEMQIQKLGVEVKLSKPITLLEAKQLGADVFVIATGTTPFVPAISGVDNKMVTVGVEALHNPNKVGQHCIIYGGGMLAAQLADLLMSKGKYQIIIIARSEILKKANFSEKEYYLNRLKNFGVKVLENTQIVEIRPNSVVIETSDNWKMEMHDVDSVIMATGWMPLIHLATELQAIGLNTITIGDALGPRKLLNAVQEGAFAALNI